MHIPVATFFGMLVAVWLIINELISILENLARLETPLPGFLLELVQHFKVVVEAQGNELVNSQSDLEKQEEKNE